jgi:hypothetical protein
MHCGRALADPERIPGRLLERSPRNLGGRDEWYNALVTLMGSPAENDKVRLADHADQRPSRMNDDADLVATPRAAGDVTPRQEPNQDLVWFQGPQGLPTTEDRRGPSRRTGEATKFCRCQQLCPADLAAESPDASHEISPPSLAATPLQRGRNSPETQTPWFHPTHGRTRAPLTWQETASGRSEFSLPGG